MTCKVCGRPATYKSGPLCHTHYEKLRRSGTLIYRRKPSHCNECERPVVARGLCQNHYMKLKRTGTFERFRQPRPGWSRSDFHRHHRYGLTPQDAAELRAFQEGNCGICRQPLPENPKHIHQDHDHETGEPRGLLCRNCNLVLAAVESRRVPAQWFTEYLDDWKIYHEDELREEANRLGIQ